MRIGILGGSFDPVHLGHLAAAEAARERLRLDRVVFVVAASQPLKTEGPRASGEDRYAMVGLAVRGRPGFEVSDLELQRAGPSYTVDTLRELQRLHPPSTELVLLLGADALAELPGWRSAEEILERVAVAGVARPGAPLPTEDRLARAFGKRRARALAAAFVEAETPDISSSAIRAKVAAGESLQGLVPEDVEAYITKRGLYRA